MYQKAASINMLWFCNFKPPHIAFSSNDLLAPWQMVVTTILCAQIIGHGALCVMAFIMVDKTIENAIIFKYKACREEVLLWIQWQLSSML